jgi:hypothetical protein
MPSEIMSKSSVDSAALAAALVACVAGLLLIPSGFVWLTSILGLTILITVLSYDQEGYRTILQSIAFAGTCGLCFTVAAIAPYVFIYGLPNAQEPVLVSRWLPFTWLFVTVLLIIVDRARMGARAVTAQAGAASLGSVFTPKSSAAAPVLASASSVADSSVAYSQPHLVRDQAPVASPVAAPPPPPPARDPAPAPVSPAPPHLVEIYVHLTGESLNLMRSVMAEPLGRDYYRITDTMPDNETWQFTPGQVVRCKKQNLSTGKAMVAVEEAPRAQ